MRFLSRRLASVPSEETGHDLKEILIGVQDSIRLRAEDRHQIVAGRLAALEHEHQVLGELKEALA